MPAAFFREADLGCRFAQVDLDRQRLIGAQHFKQERQLAKAAGDVGAQLLWLVFID